jgi:hypothetical protein
MENPSNGEIFTVVSKPVNVIGSKGMNRRQLKDLNTQMR